MRTVVDLGCYAHPDHQGMSQNSVAQLIDRFRPERLYGYDPVQHPAFFEENGCWVHLQPLAAWTYDGTVGWDPRAGQPLTASIGIGTDHTVQCFDLAAYLLHQPSPVILKVDVEGGEYDLLEHVLARGCADKIDKLLVEWHRADLWGNRLRKRRILDSFAAEPWQ